MKAKKKSIQEFFEIKISLIENEIKELKELLKRKKIEKIEGLWKGVKIDDNLIEEAKKAIFKNV